MEGAKLKAEALKIETEAELERMKAAREADIKFNLEQNKMEIEKCQVDFFYPLAVCDIFLLYSEKKLIG